MAKILLIEDYLPLLRAYQITFSKLGYEIEHATDGEEGIAKAKSQKPELILLDLFLPKKDGFEVLKELKSDPKYKHIPIICLSVLSQEEDIKKSKELGADDYMVKTEVSLKEIVKRVSQRLRST